MGGLVADNILKAISRKEEPLVNHFVFDGRTGAGMVYTFPAQVQPGPAFALLTDTSVLHFQVLRAAAVRSVLNRRFWPLQGKCAGDKKRPRDEEEETEL